MKKFIKLKILQVVGNLKQLPIYLARKPKMIYNLYKLDIYEYLNKLDILECIYKNKKN